MDYIFVSTMIRNWRQDTDELFSAISEPSEAMMLSSLPGFQLFVVIIPKDS